MYMPANPAPTITTSTSRSSVIARDRTSAPETWSLAALCAVRRAKFGLGAVGRGLDLRGVPVGAAAVAVRAGEEAAGHLQAGHALAERLRQRVGQALRAVE